MFSQAGYSFTQIQSAISFIENLNPDFINVKQEEFVKYYIFSIFSFNISYDILTI